jgi:hypothetical protein
MADCWVATAEFERLIRAVVDVALDLSPEFDRLCARRPTRHCAREAVAGAAAAG